MDRLINYAFLLLLTFLFVLEATNDVRLRIGIAVFLAMSFAYGVFILRWLTLDGAMAATVFGGVVLGLGGWKITGLVLLFFISSTLLSVNAIVVIEEAAQAYSERKRRDGIQVWANGFWIALCVILGSIFNTDLFLAGAAGAIATATADTWATELGSSRFKGSTYLITTFSPVAAGTDGGISIQGTLAGIAGSLLIAFASAYLFNLSLTSALGVIFTAGFLGCLLDSYFGATLQRDNRIFRLGSEDSLFQFQLDNNFVNWAATGFGSLVAVMLNLFLL